MRKSRFFKSIRIENISFNNAGEIAKLRRIFLAIMDDMSNQADKEFPDSGGVTEVYVTSVSKENMASFRQWLRKLHQLEASFPGFQKVYVQVPHHADDESWVTLLQFDTEKNLEHWLNSPQRQTMLVEANQLMKCQKKYQLFSSFDSWFSDAPSSYIPVWKQSMLILLALFPAVVLETRYLLPLMSEFNPVLTRFLGVVIIVCSISWILMPLTLFLLSWWLTPGSEMKEYLGVFTVIILYMLEIAIFLSTQ